MEGIKYQLKALKFHLMNKREALKVFEQGNDITKEPWRKIKLVFKGSLDFNKE